jgi:ribonuclease HI
MKQKYYVVFIGRHVGVFENKAEFEAQIKGYPNALFQVHKSKVAAYRALRNGSAKSRKTKRTKEKSNKIFGDILKGGIKIRGFQDLKRQTCGYHLISLESGEVFYSEETIKTGSTIIGEFLGLMKALRLSRRMKNPLPLLSNCDVAIKWINNKKVNTKCEINTTLQKRLRRETSWLRSNDPINEIIKWKPEVWLRKSTIRNSLRYISNNEIIT